MSEINVTPMVDVMLVLLIVFMVTAPLIQQGVPVELPRTRAQSMDADPDRVVLTLTADRRAFIAAAEVPLAQLRARLAENRKLQADRQIYLHADRGLPYGFVVDVMATLKDAGVEGLGMVTDPLQGAPSR